MFMESENVIISAEKSLNEINAGPFVIPTEGSLV